MKRIVADQPPPQSGQQNVALMVLDDVRARIKHGIQRYGTALHTFNGRNALIDAYQEALDLVFYLRQAIAEMDASMNIGDAEDTDGK